MRKTGNESFSDTRGFLKVLLLIVLCSFVFSLNASTVNADLVANFTWEPQYPIKDEEVTFNATDSTGPIENYSWNFDEDSLFNDGTGIINKTSFTEVRDYEIGLNVSNTSGYWNTTKKNISINSVPTANFTYEPEYPEIGEDVTLNASGSSDSDGTIEEYKWDLNGDGNYDDKTGVEVQTSFNSIGDKTVGVQVTDNESATNNITKDITVNAVPEANFTYYPENPQTGEEVTFNASLSNDTDGTIASYDWDLTGDGNYNHNNESEGKIYDESGTYSVTLNVTDDRGSTDNITKTITVENTGPIANFTYAPQFPEKGENITVDASDSYDPDGEIVSYDWELTNDTSYGDGSGVTNKTSFDTAGIYILRLNVTDNEGAWDNTSREVKVNFLPEPDFTYNPTHPTIYNDIEFNASLSSDIDGEVVDYEWDMYTDNTWDDGSKKVVYHNYSNPGDYNVSLKVKDDSGFWANTTKEITVNKIPDANFTFSPEVPLAGNPVTMNASVTVDDGTISNYFWDVEGDDGWDIVGSDKEVITKTYEDAQDIDITLRAEDEYGETDEITKTLHVNYPPTANFTYDPKNPNTADIIEFNATTSSDPNGGALSYSWDLNEDGNYSNDAGEFILHNFITPGDHQVSLKVTDNYGEEDIKTKDIYVTQAESCETISSNYTMDSDLDCSDHNANGIKINGSDLVLDCNGYSIIGNSSGFHGIHIEYPYSDAMDNVTVKNCNVVNFSVGIYKEGTSEDLIEGFTSNGNKFINNTITNSEYYGIKIKGSKGAIIKDNKIFGSIESPFYGIHVDYSKNIYVGDNEIAKKNTPSGDEGSKVAKGVHFDRTESSCICSNSISETNTGIDLKRSSNNSINNNSILEVDITGIDIFRGCNHNNITYNYITGIEGSLGSSYGMRFNPNSDESSPAEHNRVIGNTFENFNSSDSTNGVGIHLGSLAYNNSLFLNNFIDNEISVFSSSGSNNYLNSSEKLSYIFNGGSLEEYLGNYWSDYEGSDGSNDGVGDTPYTISNDNDDLMPLIEPLINYGFIPTGTITTYPEIPVVNETITISAGKSYDLGGSIASYSWNINGDETYGDREGRIITENFSEEGFHMIRVNITDNGGNFVIAERNVSVNLPPVAELSHTPDVPEVDETITLNASESFDSDGSVIRYEWDLDGDGDFGDSSGESIATVSFGEEGKHEVSIRVTDNKEASDIKNIVINVNSGPLADFEFSPTYPSTEEPVSFDASSSISAYDYFWDLDGDGVYDDSTGSSTTSHTFNTSGNHEVGLRIEDEFGANDSTRKNVSINKRPVVKFTYTPEIPIVNETINLNASESFDSDGYITNYSWDLNGNGAYTDEEGMITKVNFSSNGTHEIGLKLKDNASGTNYTRLNINVNSKPNADFSFSQIEGLTVEFARTSVDPDGNIFTTDWDLDGDGTYDADGAEITYEYGDYGNYDVSMRVTDNEGASNVVTKQVEVDSLVARFTYTPLSSSVGDEITFNASESEGTIAEYLWDLDGDGDFGDSSGTQAVSYSYDEGGNHTVALKIRNYNDAVDVTEHIIYINSGPFANLTYNPHHPTTGESVQFDASNSYDDEGSIFYDWYVDSEKRDGVNGDSITESFSTYGPHNVTVRVRDEKGIYNASTVILDVNSKPIPRISYDLTKPSINDEIHFSADSSSDPDGTVEGYEWDFDGDGIWDSIKKSPSYSYSESRYYNVTLRVTDDDGVKNTTKIEIYVNEDPKANFTYTPEYPNIGEEVTFNGSHSFDNGGSITSYNWDFGNNGSTEKTGEIVKWTYEEEGSHDVKLTVTDDQDPGNTNSKVVTVNVNSAPTANFTYSPSSPSVGQNITLNASISEDTEGNIEKYYWDLNYNGTYIEGGMINNISFKSSGEHNISLKVNDSGYLGDNITKTIFVDSPGDEIVVGSGGDYNSIQTAVEAANPGDTIKIQSGTYEENVRVNKTLIITGEDTGSGLPIIDGNNTSSVFTLTGENIKLEKTIIRNSGSSRDDAGVKILSEGCNLTSNTIYSNDGNGILFAEENQTAGTIISRNEISDNSLKGILINNTVPNDSFGARINENNITGNQEENVFVRDSSEIYLTQNNLSEGSEGIYLQGSDNNKIYANTIFNNLNTGISLYNSQGNNIHTNNVFGNTLNVNSTESESLWTSPEKVNYTYGGTEYEGFLGNYWGDYTGNDPDGDGIGNSSYNISSSENGTKPLMESLVNYMPMNYHPYADFTYSPSNPETDQSVSFNALNSYDLDGPSINYHWDFNDDGNYENEGGEVSYTYSSSGDHLVTLLVNDTAGHISKHSETVTVKSTSGGGGSITTSYTPTSEPITSTSDGEITVTNLDMDSGEEEIIDTSGDADSFVSLNINAEEGVSDGELIIKELEEGIYSVSGEGKETYISFNISSSFSASGELTFRVEKTWIESNDIRDVNLMVKEGSDWNLLTTNRINETENYIHYRSQIPHFSIFSIVGTKSVEDDDEVFALSPDFKCRGFKESEVPNEWEVVEECPQKKYGTKDNKCEVFWGSIPAGWEEIPMNCETWREMREAKTLIDDAKRTINTTEGNASDLLEEAEEEFTEGNYLEAEDLARKAIDAWEKRGRMDIMNYLVPIIAILIIVGLLTAFYFLKSGKLSFYSSKSNDIKKREHIEIKNAVKKYKNKKRDFNPYKKESTGISKEELEEKLSDISHSLTKKVHKLKSDSKLEGDSKKLANRITRGLEQAYDYKESNELSKAQRTFNHAKKLYKRFKETYNNE